MNRAARAGLLLATLIGLAIAGWTVDSIGADQVLRAIGSIGWIGMGVFVAWSGGVLLLLGLAWHAVARGQARGRFGLFVWARTTREAATDVLPFSQIGGIVVGVRTLTARRVPGEVVYASMVADMTAEMAAQLLCTLAGVAVLVSILSATPVAVGLVPIAIMGLAAMVGMAALFAFGQRPLLGLASRIGARLLPGSVATMTAVRAELDAVYREPRRMIASFLLNLAAWIASAAGAWIALRFMGSDAKLWQVLTLEMLIFTVRSVAFMIPGAIGVQEVVYTLLAPALGVTPTAALALSLLKRARDLMIGVPALLVWQAGESVAAIRA